MACPALADGLSTSNSADLPGIPCSFSSAGSTTFRPMAPPNDDQDSLLALFCSMASRDIITVDQLPQLFEQTTPAYGASEVHNALLVVTTPARLASGVLPFEDVLGVWKNLRASSPMHPPADLGFPDGGRRATAPAGALHRGKDGFLAATPAVWLSIVTTVITAVISLVIMGFAVAYLWRFAEDEQVNMLQRQMELVRDTVTSLSVETNPKLQTSQLIFTVDLLQKIFRFAGCVPANSQLQEQVTYTQRILRASLDKSYQIWSVAQAEQRVQWTADVMAVTLPALGLPATARLVQGWNVQRTESVVLGQWAGAAGGDVRLLTQPPAWLCPAAACNSTLEALARATLGGNASQVTPVLPDVWAGGRSLDALGVAVLCVIDMRMWKAVFSQVQARSLANASGGALSINLTVMAPLTRPNSSSKWYFTSTAVVPGLQRFLAVGAATVPMWLNFLRDAGQAFERISRSTNSTERLLLARKSNRNPACIECLTPTYCIGKCLGQNISFEGLTLATTRCLSGDMVGYDWHGTAVVSAYTCIPEMNGGFALLLNKAEMQERGLTMVVDYINRQNALLNSTTEEIVLGEPRPGLTPAQVQYSGDIVFLTDLRYKGQCPAAGCGTSKGLASPIVQALHGVETVVETPDYHLAPVVAVTSFIASLGVGLVVKEDVWEMVAPPNRATVRFVLTCFAVTTFCLLALLFLIRLIVSRIQRMWLQWREVEAVQQEQRRVFLDCMYPIPVANEFVSRHCLPGRHTSFMLSLPGAVVFFSDIWGFKVLVNNLTPDQLLSFLGYTFGMMDLIAAHAGVSRVKLVGDSYMAVAGLPSHGATACRDMVYFAACCAQAFSDRYVHSAHSPHALGRTFSETRSTLSALDDVWSALGEQADQPVELDELRHFPWWNAQSITNQRNSTPCIMRYGVAAGPAMAGILPGLVPMFDVFGAAVVAASRLERSCPPGRIHVCPEVYRQLAGDCGHGAFFRFSLRHEIPVRTGDPVVGHYLQSTLRPLPPGLARGLGLHVAERAGEGLEGMPTTASMVDIGNSYSRTMVASSTFVNVAALRQRG
eukprot:EG_transcript_764